MQNRHRISLVLVVTLLVGSAAWAAPLDPTSVEIAGTLGLAQSAAHGCLAVWVPVNRDLALSGIKWYNNDGSVAFPIISVQSGSPEYPVSLTDAFPVAEAVFGQSLGWSEATFSEPVAAEGAGLYVILQVPSGGIATAAGAGGGPAVGYTSASMGMPGWLSGDGEDWMRIHPDFGFAVIPEFVPRTEGMLAKTANRGGGGSGGAGDGAKDHPAATLLSPAIPNPFNPQTTLRFSLVQDGQVDLAVYTLRGELVKVFVSQPMSAGTHEVMWDGRNANGMTMASGVYVARLVSGSVTTVQRLTLVR